MTRLRDFLERYPQPDLGPGNPFNPQGSRKYIIVCTHCHYDHILGVEEFAGEMLVASAHGKSFITSDLPTHSLCKSLGIKTPNYNITHWVDHLARLPSPFGGELEGLRVLHTPGHTPDSLAIYDKDERMLFVGDTLYEWAPIIFPPEGGNIGDWLNSVRMLLQFVRHEEDSHPDGFKRQVKISCGHVTAGGPAREILEQCLAFVEDVVGGKVQAKQRVEIRGHDAALWEVPGSARFVLLAPIQLVEDARRPV